MLFKVTGELRQTYHTPQELIALSGLELIESEDVFLYGFEEADKTFFVFRKTQA